MYLILLSPSTEALFPPQLLRVIDLINVLGSKWGFALCHDGFLKVARKWNFGEVDDLQYGQEG